MMTVKIIGLAVLAGVLAVATEAGLIVVLKNGRVERRDENGHYLGSVGSAGALAAASDGETIAIVEAAGNVKRYDTKGRYQGSVGSGKAATVQVTSGQIIVTYADGKLKRYDARSGRYLGSL
jgi:hypothetical protein